jgi:hypothetical protein
VAVEGLRAGKGTSLGVVPDAEVEPERRGAGTRLRHRARHRRVLAARLDQRDPDGRDDRGQGSDRDDADDSRPVGSTPLGGGDHGPNVPATPSTRYAPLY